MEAFILIAIIYTNTWTSYGLTTLTERFPREEACLIAAAEIKAMVKRANKSAEVSCTKVKL